MTQMPSLFLTHGAPTLYLEDVPARRFLADLGKSLGRPEAIVVASSHWVAQDVKISGLIRQTTLHDFYGFPEPLYDLRYEPPGAPALVTQLSQLCGQAGFCTSLTQRGLDHGAWAPLALMYPEADIPTVQISLLSDFDPARHVALGKALSGLREQGVLVIGSGSMTHNLRDYGRYGLDEGAPAYVEAFANWVAENLMAGNHDALLEYRLRGPEAAHNHPTPEHFLPLFVAMGAGGTEVTQLHKSTTHGILRMDAYAFN